MNEIKKTSAEMLVILKDMSAEAGDTYIVSEKLVLEKDTVYSSNGATVMAQGGIEVIGSGTSLYKTRIVSDKCINVSGDDFTLQDCDIEAGSCAVCAKGKRFIAKNNKINVTEGGVAVELCHGSQNGLIALNNTSNGSLKISGALNCAVILNEARSVIAQGNTNLYIVKNTLDSATLRENKYLVCDENTVLNVVSFDNCAVNGDNIQDMDVRPEFGTNDELLPHLNKDLFLDMERKETVTDPACSERRSYADYLLSQSESEYVVIIPPGVYAVDKHVELNIAHSNTEIYAYGVYAESITRAESVLINRAENIKLRGLVLGYALPSSGQMHIIEKLGSYRLRVMPTAGYEDGFGKTDISVFHNNYTDLFHKDGMSPYASIGGYYSIEKDADGTYLMTFNPPGYGTPSYEQYKYFDCYDEMTVGDVIVCRMAGASSQTVRMEGASNIDIKDVCVYGYAGGTIFRIKNGCKNINFERYQATTHSPYVIDKAISERYAKISAKYNNFDFGIYTDEQGRLRGGEPHVCGIGGMEVQDCITGVNLRSCIIEKIFDDGSNQRSTSSRLAGVDNNADGTYTVYFKGCLSSVYHKIVYSRDTSKRIFAPGKCPDVKKGDLIFAYGSNGAVLFDNAEALEDAKPLTGSYGHWAHTDFDGDGICDVCGRAIADSAVKVHPARNSRYDSENGTVMFEVQRNGKEDMLTFTTTLYAVKVKAENVDMTALEGYDLLANSYDSGSQFFLDNVSRVCAGITFDNLKIHNHRSRAFLIKTRNVTVKNCTFRNLRLQGLIIGRETNWGESSVPRNVLVEGCVFDGTCDLDRTNLEHVEHAQINIQGLGEACNDVIPSENFACSNITIRHNKFLNTKNQRIIYASGVNGLTVTENIFEEKAGGVVLHLDGCLDVNISDNFYSSEMQRAIDEKELDKAFVLRNYRALTVEGTSLSDSE